MTEYKTTKKKMSPAEELSYRAESMGLPKTASRAEVEAAEKKFSEAHAWQNKVGLPIPRRKGANEATARKAAAKHGEDAREAERKRRRKRLSAETQADGIEK